MKKNELEALSIDQYFTKDNAPANLAEHEEAKEKKMKELEKQAGVPFGYEVRPQRKTKLVQCYVNPDIRNKLQEYADEEGISVNKFLDCLILAYINIREGREVPPIQCYTDKKTGLTFTKIAKDKGLTASELLETLIKEYISMPPTV